MDLRPLSLGEQMDRAVTLCVRNVLPLSLIYLAFGVVLGIFQLYGRGDESKIVGGIVDLFHAHTDKAVTFKDISAIIDKQSTFNGFTVAWWCMYLLVTPIMQAALIFAASQLYFGNQVSFSQAYKQGLRYWLPLLGVSFLYTVSGMVLYGILLLLGFAVFPAAGLLIALWRPLGVSFGILAGIGWVIVFFLVAALLWFAITISYFTCVLEQVGFVRSFTRGLERVCSSVGLRGSLTASMALGAVYCGIGLVSLVGAGMIYGLLRVNVVGTAFTTLLQLLSEIFTTMFFTVFYYDLRVRREGLDLQREVAVLPLQTS